MSAALDPKSRPGDAARAFFSRSAGMLIDGEWVAAESGKTITVTDPATGLPVMTVAAGNARDIDGATKAPGLAFEGAVARDLYTEAKSTTMAFGCASPPAS